MADWSGFHNAAQTVLETGRSRSPSGLASVLSQVVKKFQADDAEKKSIELLGKTKRLEGQIDLENDPEKQFKKQLYERYLKANNGAVSGDNLLGNTSGGTLKIDALGNLKSVDALTPKEQVENITNQEILDEANKSGRPVSDVVNERNILEKEKLQNIKPYTGKEAATISMTDSVIPLLDEIIGDIEKQGNVFGNFGLGDAITTAPLSGQSRLAAFIKPSSQSTAMSSLKKGLAVGKGRELGNKLTQVMEVAFEKGGATLTKDEIMASLAGLNPEYKTEKEWVKGIEKLKQQLLHKKQLLLKDQNNYKSIKNNENSEYKIGDVFEKDGTSYKYIGDGQWEY